MEKSYVSMFLLLVAISCALAKDVGKKETKETTAKPKLPQTLSRALKKVFAEHKDIQKLAEKFILLNLVYETTDKNLSPDGQYVPRILFIDPSLTVRADITGRYSNRLYAYEPSDISLSPTYAKPSLSALSLQLDNKKCKPFTEKYLRLEDGIV
ncbi:anterior gradient protein 2 [Grus japonensis]|uniref:Anterior gradient protein 2 n=1 Tax=Grus japonensis TaxID=30415 RepID=A0ABC9WGJ0_GRUJA